MTEKQAQEIMEKVRDTGSPLPNIAEYSEALKITYNVLGNDYTNEQLDNWILIGKYPFLMPTYWNRETMQYEVDKDYKYSFTLLDEMPDGWKKAFGEMMCEEIYNALVKCNGLNDYRIEQIKEKFGQLRWYGYPSYKEVEEIIDKYSVLSENICIICGKPDVPMTGYDWVYPLCKKCYCTPNDYRKGDMTKEELKEFWDDRKKDWEVYNNKDNTMVNSYSIRKWSKEKDDIETIEYDISETANKIRSKWKAEHSKIK